MVPIKKEIGGWGISLRWQAFDKTIQQSTKGWWWQWGWHWRRDKTWAERVGGCRIVVSSIKSINKK
jgi:hypothetical protein